MPQSQAHTASAAHEGMDGGAGWTIIMSQTAMHHPNCSFIGRTLREAVYMYKCGFCYHAQTIACSSQGQVHGGYRVFDAVFVGSTI